MIARLLAYGLLIVSAAFVLPANDIAIPALAKVGMAVGAALLIAAETTEIDNRGDR